MFCDFCIAYEPKGASLCCPTSYLSSKIKTFEQQKWGQGATICPVRTFRMYRIRSKYLIGLWGGEFECASPPHIWLPSLYSPGCPPWPFPVPGAGPLPSVMASLILQPVWGGLPSAPPGRTLWTLSFNIRPAEDPHKPPYKQILSFLSSCKTPESHPIILEVREHFILATKSFSLNLCFKKKLKYVLKSP